MNSLDWRYEATKIVRELAALAERPVLAKEWDGIWDLAERARELMREAK